VIAASLAIALGAGIARRLLPFLAIGVPLVISIVLVNTFLYPGATDPIVQVGPLRPTWTGLSEAVQAVLRVMALLLAVGLFARTTESDDLLADLEQRGLGRRAVFVIGAALGTIPRLGARAIDIVEAQRARGLDTEGPPWRRVRGVVPLAGPLILAALNEVEEQTMALEARAFSAPGRRTLLHRHVERPLERPARWSLVLAGVCLAGVSLAGVLHLP
jgi:energy-coupling factor transport system permease protein